MSHYLDILLLPDPEFPVHQLLAALYSKLHRALVDFGSNNIAVSFPDYSAKPASLGSRLRLIGPQIALERLMVTGWLRGMRDHVELTALAAVPAHAAPHTLVRVQAQSNPERLRRRQIRRHGLTEASALEQVPDSAVEKLRLPFVQLTSASTGQTFRLYLRLSEAHRQSTPGPFNTYGLSHTATIPWF
jgi:CRISPR-associated endonuclease Csy4